MFTTPLTNLRQLRNLNMPIPEATKLWIGFSELGDKGVRLVCTNMPNLTILSLRKVYLIQRMPNLALKAYGLSHRTSKICNFSKSVHYLPTRIEQNWLRRRLFDCQISSEIDSTRIMYNLLTF